MPGGKSLRQTGEEEQAILRLQEVAEEGVLSWDAEVPREETGESLSSCLISADTL